MKHLYLLFILWSFFVYGQVTTTEKISPISAAEYAQSLVAPTDTGEGHRSMLLPCTLASNDNFANATLLTVNGGSVSGTTCGSLESGEATSCNTGATATVWYKFVAISATEYIKIDYTGGGCYFGSAVYNTTVLPTSACSNNPLSCQQDAYGPATQIFQFTNLTVGKTYYIQIAYNAGGACPNSVGLNIGVTTANPGGYITNPAPINSCSSPAGGCYFNSPPTTAQVTSGCTGYSLNANSYSANAVFTGYFQFTNSPSYNTAQIQAIISSNCFPAGNVNWFNWTIYSSGCGLITCGTINNLTIAGLACGGTYILQYQIELANCTSFTTIWPYQNAPSSSPACTPLPIELLYFTAIPSNDKVNIKWQTVNEINSREFIIERSYDAINFEKIQTVKALQSPSEYSLQDSPVPGQRVLYYKLSHVDNDGKTTYSKTVSVIISNGTELVKLSPNPAQQLFEIGFTEAYMNMPVVIEMYDLTGKKVLSKEMLVDSKVKLVDLNELPKGLYTVNILTSLPGLDVTKIKLAKD